MNGQHYTTKTTTANTVLAIWPTLINFPDGNLAWATSPIQKTLPAILWGQCEPQTLVRTTGI